MLLQNPQVRGGKLLQDSRGRGPYLLQTDKPGKPQQNGRHERFHRTLKAETAKPPKADRQAQQRAFDRFRREYNEERPHEALSMKTPESVYRASPRPFPSYLPEIEYPAAYEVRRVRPNGEIKWAGDLMYVGQVLAGEFVLLPPVYRP